MQSTLIAGDSLSLLDTVDQCPASDGWVFKIRLAPQSAGSAVTLTGVADGDSFRTTAGSSVTTNWAAGRYSYVKWVEKADERITVETGFIDILANAAVATVGADTRSHVEKVLANLEAMIEGRASKDVQEYTIGDRQLKHMEINELLMWRNKYKAQLAGEKAASSLSKGFGRKVMVRF